MPAPAGNAIEKKDSGLFGADGTMKGLADFYGDLDWRSRTFGSPQRTIGMGMMAAYARFGFPDLLEAARETSAAWAGEEGWKMEMLVKAVGAAKAQPPPLQVPGNGFPPR